MTNKPEVERIKGYLDDEILLGCAQLLAGYREALAAAGAPPKEVHGYSQRIAGILAAMAKHFAPEDRRWEIAKEIVDRLPNADEVTRKKDPEVYVENILDQIDSKFAREIDENMDALRTPPA